MARCTLTLLGTDVLLLGLARGRPNNAVLVVECEGRLDSDALEAAVRAVAPIAPFMTGRIERPFPWGRLRWVAGDGAPPVERRQVADERALEALVDELLGAPIDPYVGPVLRWIAVHEAGEARSWLILAWLHPLMDPRGAELLVAMVDALDRGGSAEAWARERLVVAPPDVRPWRERMAITRRSLDELRALGRLAPRSLGRDVTAPGRVRHRRIAVPVAEARQLPATLALVAECVADLFRARGLPAGLPLVVPISVDRRRKGEPGPVFGNYLSFHFARIVPSGDVAATAAAIRRDMAEAVRSDVIEGLWVAMNFGRYYPPAALLRPMGEGDGSSFNCADTGDVRPALDRVLGCRVAGAYHAPCVQPRPGLGIFFCRAAGRESIVAVWVEGVVTEREVDALLGDLGRAVSAARAA
ncbi:MAG TPA: hypothetical protein VMS22_12040 [Candidatus Eisenbacteria bacterium]|nr:hypothetical protein [Candidatus Eisenbacteria bacterium]